MNELFLSSMYAGTVLSLAAYMVGVWLKKQFRSPQPAAGGHFDHHCRAAGRAREL